MSREPALWACPSDHLCASVSDAPILFMAPTVLQAMARRFLDGFPGLVTYAVKANSDREVLENLVSAGLGAFDVASPVEMEAVRAVLPGAVLHYNNPVRSSVEIACAVRFGVTSYSVDCDGEFEKLVRGGVPPGTEVSVRLRLPVKGAAYDFGAKFGADPETARQLLQKVVSAGYSPAMTFHPGTQCEDPAAWTAYIQACADVATGLPLRRLNVGGGFPAHRVGSAPDLERIFDAIATAVSSAFGENAPLLVCEPGRAMVAEAFSLAVRVKSVRDGTVFLNDGIYGGLAEFPVLGNSDRIDVMRQGRPLPGKTKSWVVFGPTCDSLDKLPGTLTLPDTLKEGDQLLFHGLGAYSTALVTRFNGYGALTPVTVKRLQ